MNPSPLYVRIALADPALNAPTHIAELLPTADPALCQVMRLIELVDGTNPSGWFTPVNSHRMQFEPQPMVPHPAKYAEFEDIVASEINAGDFEALWQRAQQL